MKSRQISKKSKFLFGAMTFALVASPILVAVSCGESDSTTTTTKSLSAEQLRRIYDVITLPKSSEEYSAIKKDDTGNEVELITKVADYDAMIAKKKAANAAQSEIDDLNNKKARSQQLLDGKQWNQIDPGDSNWYYVQLGAAFSIGLYNKQTVNASDQDWSTSKDFAKFVYQLGQKYLTNDEKIKSWVDRYVALAISIASGATGYLPKLDAIFSEFAFLDEKAHKFLMGLTLAYRALRWSNGEFSELGLSLLLKPIKVTTETLQTLKTTLVVPLQTRIGFGQNYGETIPGGPLSDAQSTNLNGKKILTVESTALVDAKLVAGLYVEEPSKVTSSKTPAPIAGESFKINRMPAGGKPVAFGDTEFTIVGGKYGTTGVTFVFYKLEGTEYKFVSKTLYDQYKTETAINGLNNVEREKDGFGALFLSNLYTTSTVAITSPTNAMAGTSFWSTIQGFSYVLSETTIAHADSTKVKSVYVFKAADDGTIPPKVVEIIDKLVAAYKIAV